jgi:hypothetical protein
MPTVETPSCSVEGRCAVEPQPPYLSANQVGPASSASSHSRMPVRQSFFSASRMPSCHVGFSSPSQYPPPRSTIHLRCHGAACFDGDVSFFLVSSPSERTASPSHRVHNFPEASRSLLLASGKHSTGLLPRGTSQSHSLPMPDGHAPTLPTQPDLDLPLAFQVAHDFASPAVLGNHAGRQGQKETFACLPCRCYHALRCQE